jgi:hypothetical protein
MIKFSLEYEKREIHFHFCKDNLTKENLIQIIKSIFQAEDCLFYDKHRIKFSQKNNKLIISARKQFKFGKLLQGGKK